MKTITSILFLIFSILPSPFQVKMIELSHYLFPEFTQGTILMKDGKEYQTILISDGLIYDLNLPDGYSVKPYFYYWLKKDGRYLTFANNGQLKTLYPDKKDLLKEFTKQNKVKYENRESIIQLIEYLETHQRR